MSSITIHDPVVVVTDVGLSILGAFLGWRLSRTTVGAMLRTPGVLIFAGLSSAALAGAIYHAFFTGTDTRAGFIAWIPVPLSILVVSATLLELSLHLLTPRISRSIRRSIVAAYAIAFAAVVLLVDESFSTIVRFYAPALFLFLMTATWQAVRHQSRGWTLIAVSFTISGVAAVLQQARVGINPGYFDHNALYHVLQSIALFLMYQGFRRVPTTTE